jgi:multidrug efflux pump subunit AcrB
VVEDVVNEDIPQVTADHPGVSWSLAGQQQEQKDTFTDIRRGVIISLILIFALLAVPFKSYVQPFIVMSVIPFGLIGAVLGHMVMGYSLSIMSLLGMLALAGVVVNDSLVMVDYINRKRRAGMPLLDAVREAGAARFRPIILTSLTTFFGLIPMIFETSFQAKMMIPMAISLAFGVLFCTFITLILVPAEYMILEDIKAGWRWLFGKA